MSEMVEWVTRVLAEQCMRPGGFRVPDVARAVIEAMREPTEAMLKAGERGAAYGPRYMWQTMVDEELGRNALINGEVRYRPIVDQ